MCVCMCLYVWHVCVGGDVIERESARVLERERASVCVCERRCFFGQRLVQLVLLLCSLVSTRERERRCFVFSCIQCQKRPTTVSKETYYSEDALFGRATS